MGIKDTPLHVVRNGYIPKLKWIATKYVVLWDERDKRGWLVNGISALLHLVRTSLNHYSTDYFSPSFLFDFTKMKNAAGHRPNSAIEVLIHDGNKELEIYPGKSERSKEEETTNEAGAGSSKTQKKKRGYYLFEDLVEHHYNMLEQIMEHHTHAAGQNGVNLKVRMRKHLEGWDFVELATDHDPRPRVATLEALGYGWVDFIRSIDAITLFGSGFGEIIRPIGFGGMCPGWKSLPTQKYYLAASVFDMKEIVERFGNGWGNRHKSIHDLLWHCPRGVVAPCQCQSRPTRTQHHDPVQVFYPKSSRLISRIQGPDRMEDNGAVVFGHSFTWRYHWRNNGRKELEKGDPPLAIFDRQTIPPTQYYSLDPASETTDLSLANRNPHSGATRSSTSAYLAYTTPTESVPDSAQDLITAESESISITSRSNQSAVSERNRAKARTLRREKRHL